MTVRVVEGRYYSRVRISPGEKGERRDIPVPQDRAAELDEHLTQVANDLRKAGQSLPVIERMLIEVMRTKTERDWLTVQRAVQAIVEGKTLPKLAGGTSFGEFATEYLSGELSLRFPDHIPVREPGTIEDDRARLRLYVLPHLRDIPLSAITLDHCDAVMSQLPTNYKGGRAMSRATRRHVAQVIRRMLALAAYPCRYIPVSPIPKGWLPRVGKPPRYPFLYPDEDAKLLSCKDVPLVNRVLYGLLAREGTRGPSEALAIPIHRIDFVHGTYGLGDNKTDDPRGWVLGSDVAQALQIWVEHFHPKAEPNSLLLLDPATNAPPEDSGHLANKFREHLRVAGVDRPELFESSDLRRPIRAHDLRATFITLALAQGKSEQWVMDRTGHTTSAMLQRYRRAARTVAEARMTTLVPLHMAIPEFGPFLTKTVPPLSEPVDATRTPSTRSSGQPSGAPSLPN